MQQDVYARHIENEKKHWWFSARREIVYSFLKKIKKKKNFTILDFGSGSGTNVEMLSSFGKVDLFEKNLKARLHLKYRFKKKNIKIINKIKKKNYDFILVADVLEHIRDDKKAIKEFLQYLRKDGHILITVPAFNFLFSSKDKALKHYRRYRTSDITDLLKKYFQIKKISYFNFFLFIPIALSIFFMKLKKEKFIDFAETTPFYPINFILKKIFYIEKFFLRFIKFPFGISIIALAKKND